LESLLESKPSGLDEQKTKSKPFGIPFGIPFGVQTFRFERAKNQIQTFWSPNLLESKPSGLDESNIKSKPFGVQAFRFGQVKKRLHMEYITIILYDINH
jgi:hypothetical protein